MFYSQFTYWPLFMSAFDVESAPTPFVVLDGYINSMQLWQCVYALFYFRSEHNRRYVLAVIHLARNNNQSDIKSPMVRHLCLLFHNYVILEL